MLVVSYFAVSRYGLWSSVGSQSEVVQWVPPLFLLKAGVPTKSVKQRAPFTLVQLGTTCNMILGTASSGTWSLLVTVWLKLHGFPQSFSGITMFLFWLGCSIQFSLKQMPQVLSGFHPLNSLWKRNQPKNGLFFSQMQAKESTTAHCVRFKVTSPYPLARFREPKNFQEGSMKLPWVGGLPWVLCPKLSRTCSGPCSPFCGNSHGAHRGQSS